MELIDFGKIASVLNSANQANLNRNIAPIHTGQIQTASHNFGNTTDAIRNAQFLSGTPKNFLWAVNSWDDGINRVN